MIKLKKHNNPRKLQLKCQKIIKVILADDHQIMLDGINAMLESDEEIAVVGTANNGIEVLEMLKSQPADVLLLDFQMPVMDGLETTLHVKNQYPELNVLMLTTNDEGSIITSIFKRGATGYLLKNCSKETLIQGIKDAAKGKKVLSAHLTAIMIDSLSEKPKKKKGDIPIITKRELEVFTITVKGVFYTTDS